MIRLLTALLYPTTFCHTLACNFDALRYKRDINDSASYPNFIPGTIGPADATTLGYTLSHHALPITRGTAPPTQGVPQSSFSHFGLIVPDIRAAQARIKSKGVTIVRKVGDTMNPDSPIPAAFGFPNREAFEEGILGLQVLGFYDFMTIADPDGNLLEVIEQYWCSAERRELNSKLVGTVFEDYSRTDMGVA